MSIEIYFIRNEEGEWLQDGEEQESLGSVGSLFNLALLLGHVVKSLRGLEDEDVQRSLAEYDTYVHEHREEKIASFDGFVEFVNSAVEEMREGDQEWDGFDQDLDPADFDPDIRAYIGGFLLSGQPIEPRHGLRLLAFTGFALAALNTWAEQIEESDGEGAAEIKLVCESLQHVLKFAEQSVAEDRLMYVEC